MAEYHIALHGIQNELHFVLKNLLLQSFTAITLEVVELVAKQVLSHFSIQLKVAATLQISIPEE